MTRSRALRATINLCCALVGWLNVESAGAAEGDPSRDAGEATLLPPERRAIQVIAGEEQIVDAEVARNQGLTIVDLGDGWVPAILDHYREVYTALATDRGDLDGQPLAAGERNYLELYGVPPSLSVLRRRFLEDAARDCAGSYDRQILLSVDEIRTWGASTEQKELARHRARALRLEAARTAAGVESLETLGERDPRQAKEVAAHRRFESERTAFAEAEKRLYCEGLLSPAKHKPGVYDTAMRTAMLAFQQKHAVMDQADISRRTLEALARDPLENDLLALRRALAERAVHAGGFIEDGSIGISTSDPDYPTYLGADGARHRVPDLVGAATTALLGALGIATADDAIAFFRRHRRDDFQWLKAAVRFPTPPEYYGPAMDLSIEIDRGDVWYDFPFDASGARLPQPRERFPSLTV